MLVGDSFLYSNLLILIESVVFDRMTKMTIKILWSLYSTGKLLRGWLTKQRNFSIIFALFITIH